MKRTTLWLTLVVVVTAGSFGALISYSIKQEKPYKIPWNSVEGKLVWEKYSCVQCHSLVGNGGYSAPDLTDVVIKRDEEWLEQFFLDPPIMRPSKSKYHLKLDEVEASRVIEYLGFVGKINKLNWPPPPSDFLNNGQSKESGQK